MSARLLWAGLLAPFREALPPGRAWLLGTLAVALLHPRIAPSSTEGLVSLLYPVARLVFVIWDWVLLAAAGSAVPSVS